MSKIKSNSIFSSLFTSVTPDGLEEKIDNFLNEMFDDWEDGYKIISTNYSTCFVPPETIVYSCLIIYDCESINENT